MLNHVGLLVNGPALEGLAPYLVIRLKTKLTSPGWPYCLPESAEMAIRLDLTTGAFSLRSGGGEVPAAFRQEEQELLLQVPGHVSP